MNYTILSGGDYLHASWLNVLIAVGEFNQQFGGPLNLDVTASSVTTGYATLIFNNNVHEIGGCDVYEGEAKTNRKFDIIYHESASSGHHVWENQRLIWLDDQHVQIVVTGADAEPAAISDMSLFFVSRFDAIRSLNPYA